jgi:hypothetical protein
MKVGAGKLRGSLTGAGSAGAYTESEKLAMELQMQFKASKLSNYKELTWTGDLLTATDVYEDNSKAVKLFNLVLSYDVNDVLVQTVLTRISDSATLTKTFEYNPVTDVLNVVEQTTA